MATSKFIKKFETTAGAKLQGALIYLVPQGAAFNTDMILTEHPTRKGYYSREAVPDGEYSIYINTGTGAALYEPNVWHGENKVSLISANYNEDGTVKTQVIKDSATADETNKYISKILDEAGNIIFAVDRLNKKIWIGNGYAIENLTPVSADDILMN